MKFCMNRDTVSVSLLQRKFGMGYARAGRIVDDLERLGIVEKFAGSKPRKINHTELEKTARRRGAEPYLRAVVFILSSG